LIHLYSWSSPNALKVEIMLEETGLSYELRPVNLDQGEHERPEFLMINPNGKVPAIIDDEGSGGRSVTVFESGAILLYLAEKSGRFLADNPAERWRAVSWVMFQMSGLGPMLAQAGYFLHRAPEPVPAAVDRYLVEAERLFGVMERQLSQTEYLAGDYSIADMACFPWVRNHGRFGLEINEFSGVARWLETVSSRPAVGRALAAG
jgi:GST-like protein